MKLPQFRGYEDPDELAEVVTHFMSGLRLGNALAKRRANA